jgi:hypothetical protein
VEGRSSLLVEKRGRVLDVLDFTSCEGFWHEVLMTYKHSAIMTSPPLGGPYFNVNELTHASYCEKLRLSTKPRLRMMPDPGFLRGIK